MKKRLEKNNMEHKSLWGDRRIANIFTSFMIGGVVA